MLQQEIRDSQQQKLEREKQEIRSQIAESHGRQRELQSVVGDLQMSIDDVRIKVS